MPLNKITLKSKLEAELQKQGFELGGEYAMATKLAEAIANAVVDEITQSAQVPVTGGSSAGNYKVTPDFR